MKTGKPVRLSAHAMSRARERGASEDEIIAAILHGSREPARQGKWRVKHQLPYGGRSPFGEMRYNEKTVEVIYADEPGEVVVITVKVFYRGRED